MLLKDMDNKLKSFQKYVIGLRKQKKYLLPHIENMDETPVTFDMIGNKTIDMKRTKTIHIKTTGHEKSHLTVVSYLQEELIIIDSNNNMKLQLRNGYQQF
ncbi:HTH CENPB-type domain-containing protein [Trichonephila clavipes]|nr:HTH CENPB-type domain-containing protein [Trichonephila clavipes]